MAETRTGDTSGRGGGGPGATTPARVALAGPVPDGLAGALAAVGFEVRRLDGDGDAPDLVLVGPGGEREEAVSHLRAHGTEVVLLALDLVGDGRGRDLSRAVAADDVVTLAGVDGDRWVDVVVAADERARLRRRLVRLQENLSASEARFRNTIERIADGVVVVDAEGSIVFCNPAAEALFGRDLQALEGSAFGLPLLVGETTEVEIHRPGGGARVAELRVVETTWSGDPALLVSLRDITDRREGEERRIRLIREQAARAEAEAAARRAELLAEASRELASSLQLDGVLGLLASFLVENVGDHVILDVFRESEGDRVYRLTLAAGEDPAVARLAPAETTSSACVDRVRREGTSLLLTGLGDGKLDEICADPRQRDVLAALSPTSLLVVPLALGDAAYGTVTVARGPGREPFSEAQRTLVEETARRAALAAENARLYGLVEQASRAKSDFLAVISHELRTPLTGITGYAGLLLEGVGGVLPEAASDYVDGIVRNAESLLAVIDQILLFVSTDSEREQVKYVEAEVDEILDDVVGLARPMAERSGLKLVVERPEGPARVVTDGRMVRQILLHLVANAVKFTEKGTVRVEGAVEGDTLVFRVRDTGIGIPADRMEDIFEPFRQVEAPRTRSVGGTGLGLNVVRNLVHLLQGDIRVESEPGRGSTFVVSIPVGRPAAAPNADEASGPA